MTTSGISNDNTSCSDDGYELDIERCYSRSITRTSKGQQRWFDRGLIWMYGYNHEEAIECYKRAASNRSGDRAVMAHWGIAYAIGPNYNKTWTAFEPDEKVEAIQIAVDALQECSKILQEQELIVTPVEIALVDALKHRYPNTVEETAVDDFTAYNDAFCNAMRHVYEQYPEDLDVITIFVEAMLNRTPWKLWDLHNGNCPAKGADTLEAVQVMEQAFDTIDEAWQHPGLLHMYIHLMEMSPYPERALRHGDALFALCTTSCPDAGHLLHMATHIDVLVGDYNNVVTRNQIAIIADCKYASSTRGTQNFYSIYRCHNFHFKLYGAMFLGQYHTAIRTANELIEAIPEHFLRIPGMADWFEGFIPMKQHVMIRFGRWNDILEQTLYNDKELYCFTNALIRYARTIALANVGRIDDAEQESKLFFQARDQVPSTRMLFNNTCIDLLKIAEHMMRGELEYHAAMAMEEDNVDQIEKAFDCLRKAIELDDHLPYDEPWGWMQPTRHALGALLLEQGKYQEAELVYRADLGLEMTAAGETENTLNRSCQHPNNIWGLHGLYECLVHSNAIVEAKYVKIQLDKAMARTDVPIHSSCFCRQNHEHRQRPEDQQVLHQQSKCCS